MEEILIRLMEEGDKPFILSTWLRSYYHGSRFASDLSHDVYFDFHQRVIKRLFQREGSQVLIACLREEPSVILGYLAYEKSEEFGTILHYAYVKADFRNSGLAKRLLQVPQIDLAKGAKVTHKMRDQAWLYARFPSLTYVPYLI